MASTLGRRVAKSLTSLQTRSVRVLVKPYPITFAERRSVLQVLEKHGAIEMFRMTPGHYGSFISITKSAQTAEKLFTASPLTYAVATERKAFDTSLADLSATGEALPHTHLVENTAPPDDANIEQKTFTLEVVPAPDYNHEMTFARLPEHNSWPASYTSKSSFMTAALQQSLPDDITTKGFARWDNDPDDLGAPSRKNERVALAAWMPSTMKKSSERRD